MKPIAASGYFNAFMVSRPVRARGLKLKKIVNVIYIVVSRPVRARGLKLVLGSLKGLFTGGRAPCGRVD
ncbi:TPA: hypothetical protein I8652_001081 [Legionella pneumophila]|nr:hypothetical protein [Legionella pneumophila]HAT3863500.1 hypothetical protein [Legionella pneumophila]HAT3879407.1 hypothetical protein [Legionella pneumophila]HAT3978768.1 hypothetical protein [Legionella pneumophila]HAT5915847.1 hypothetical protein [Legionella pneumophila]